jgi:hypothetical protein
LIKCHLGRGVWFHTYVLHKGATTRNIPTTADTLATHG